MAAAQLAPLLLAWFMLSLALARGCTGTSRFVLGGAFAGFAAGVAGAAALAAAGQGEILVEIVKTSVGGSLVALWGIAVVSLYRNGGHGEKRSRPAGMVGQPFRTGATVLLSGLAAGTLCACQLTGSGGPLPRLVLLVSAAGLASAAAGLVERKVPRAVAVTGPSLAAAIVAHLLFLAACSPRLDLFSPLTMKVMKFIHDLVHQSFESLLIPDHPFFRPDVWGYIGLLFGNGVGFWGGLILWFTPVLLIGLAVRLEPLPSVAHIRQGAMRRTLLASAMADRRFRLIPVCLCVAILAAAVYQSRFPHVEYWDPKPLQVAATPAGQILIPKKGEIDLTDGRIHKYLFARGGKEARFLVLMKPAGTMVVTLDACAICKPDGYGQAEGTVICHYCKTLIPVDTVGKTGGCNPVPIPFNETADGVQIDSTVLLNSWITTVQATDRVKGGGP